VCLGGQRPLCYFLRGRVCISVNLACRRGVKCFRNWRSITCGHEIMHLSRSHCLLCCKILSFLDSTTYPHCEDWLVEGQSSINICQGAEIGMWSYFWNRLCPFILEYELPNMTVVVMRSIVWFCKHIARSNRILIYVLKIENVFSYSIFVRVSQFHN
jgi:hypothetical protein